MAIPPKNLALSTQYSRVDGVSNQSIEINTENEIEKPIRNCYTQVFLHRSENNREVYLESQLRNNSITVRDFMRRLFSLTDSDKVT